MNPQQAAALTAAIDVLSQSVTKLPGLIVANLSGQRGNPQGPAAPAVPSAAGGALARASGGALSSITAVGLGFAKLLGPLLALHTLLGQSTSGFGVFQKALNLLSATIAPVLLPGMILLATALAAVSEILWKELSPGFDAFAKLVFQTGIPVLLQFAQAVLDAIEALNKIGKSDVGRAYLRGRDWLVGGDMAGDGERRAGVLGGLGGPFTPGDRARGAVGRGLADSLAEFRLSTGPAASSGSISSIYSRAQMSAFQSPFEKRMLEMVERITTAVTREGGAAMTAATAAPGTSTERAPGGR